MKILSNRSSGRWNFAAPRPRLPCLAFLDRIRIQQCLVIDHRVTVVHQRALVTHDVAAGLAVDAGLAHLEVGGAPEVVEV